MPYNDKLGIFVKHPDRVARSHVFNDPAFREEPFAPQLFEPITSLPEQFAEFVRAEAQEWGKVARDAKLRVD